MNIRSALSGIQQKCKSKAFTRSLWPALFKYCNLLLIPRVDLFRPVRPYTGSWITVGPAQCHCVAHQGPKTLQQNDTRTWLVSHLPNDDIDMLARHLVDLAMSVLFEK